MTAALTPADDGYCVDVQFVPAKAFRAWHPQAPSGAVACTERVEDGPIVARITFCQGCVTPEVASHELTHALLLWALRAGVSDWEALAYAMGRMAGQLAKMVEDRDAQSIRRA